MEKKKPRWAKIITIITFSLLSSVCSLSSRANEQPLQGGTLNVGLASDTPIIDPSITGNSVTALISRNLVDSLVGQAEDNHFTPWLATRWEINDNNTEYTFHLRPDVTFSDGTPLDAAAIKYNLDRILDPKTTSSYAKSLLGPIESITTPDNNTVVIRYASSFAPLLQGLSLPYLGIQSPTYLKKTLNTSNTVVGSGPFVLTSFVKGNGSRLSKRPDYHWGPGYAAHNGPAYLDSMVFKYLPESSVRLGALRSGQIQAIDAVPPANDKSVQSNRQLQVITRENPGVNRVLFLNTANGPFRDSKIRQAFLRASDTATAVKIAWFGTRKAADNVVGPSTLYYDPAVASLWGFDLANANRLLDEAGWASKDASGFRTKEGQRLSLHFVYDPSGLEAADITLFQAIQFQVKQAGFDLQLDPLDAGGQTARINAHDYDILSIYYVRAEPDILRTVFDSHYIPPNGYNYSQVHTLDDKLRKAVGASDSERKRLYGEIQREVIEHAYVVPLYIPAYQLGTTKNVHGISWATNAKPNFYDVWLSR